MENINKIEILNEKILLLNNTIDSVRSDIKYLLDLGYVPGEDNGDKQINISERIEHGYEYINMCMLKISALETEKQALTNQG